MRRKIFYAEINIPEGKGFCQTGPDSIFVETYTKQGAEMLIREYFNIMPKHIFTIREATQEDKDNAKDRRIMVATHMMIPMSCRE